MLPLDNKILIKINSFNIHSLPCLTGKRQVGRSAPAHLLSMGRLGKRKPEASRRAFCLALGQCLGTLPEQLGTLVRHFNANAQLGPVHSVFVQRVFVLCTTGTHGDHPPPATYTKCWQHASQVKSQVLAVREPWLWILALRLLSVGKQH